MSGMIRSASLRPGLLSGVAPGERDPDCRAAKDGKDDEGGFELNATKTLFSFDGLHPNRYGYAALADMFIDVMNAAGDAELPGIKLGDLFE